MQYLVLWLKTEGNQVGVPARLAGGGAQVVVNCAALPELAQCGASASRLPQKCRLGAPA